MLGTTREIGYKYKYVEEFQEKGFLWKAVNFILDLCFRNNRSSSVKICLYSNRHPLKLLISHYKQNFLPHLPLELKFLDYKINKGVFYE